MTAQQNTETAAREVLIERSFDAPRELVWKAWTDPNIFAMWWGPQGFTNPVCELDPRPGGAILIHMKSPTGMVMPITGTFEELIEPERIVFLTRAFEDAEGNAQHEVRNIVTLDEQGGKTKLTLQGILVKSPPEMVAGAVTGMGYGFNQSLDRLAEYLKSL